MPANQSADMNWFLRLYAMVRCGGPSRTASFISHNEPKVSRTYSMYMGRSEN